MSDAVAAMIDWCNEQGGINGREVIGNYYDAKITEVNNAMTEACGETFMLVGEGWSLDSAQETVRRDCGLPAVPTYSVSPQFANAPLMVQPVPNPVDYTNVQVAKAMAEAFPQEVTRSAVMYANYAATIDTKDKVLETYPTWGFDFLDCPQEYNIAGESDWKPFAQNLKECGAEVVYFTGSPYPNFENFLDAANQVGFDPIYITDVNFYDQAFADWNVDGYANKVYIRNTFVPLEEADVEPATAKYLEIVEGAGGDVNQLGEQAASAFLLWATAARACGSDLTRDCVMAELASVTEWTGGGMHAPSDPSSNLPQSCGMVMRMQGTAFERFQPADEGTFECSDDFVAQLTGPVVERAALDENRISS
jgi:ABC-type branched-subunit amino acid transport system substrate-binding protein